MKPLSREYTQEYIAMRRQQLADVSSEIVYHNRMLESIKQIRLEAVAKMHGTDMVALRIANNDIALQERMLQDLGRRAAVLCRDIEHARQHLQGAVA